MKHKQIAIVLALFSCGLTACSDFTESAADAPQEKNVVLSISNEADFVGRADSFEELIAFADVIVEGTVTHYEGSMAYRENCVYSTIQIEPIAEELYDRCNGSYAFPEALYEPETIFLDKTSLIEIIHTSTEIADET